MSKSQPIDFFDKGDSLFEAGNFLQASLAYEWDFFNAVNSEEIALSLIKKSKCQRNLLDFQASAQSLERINLHGLNDSVSYIIKNDLATSYYLAGQWETSLSELLKIAYLFPDSTHSFNFLLLSVLVNNESGNWTEAGKYAAELALLLDNENNEYKLKPIIDSLYCSKNLPRLSSINKIHWFSTIIPGSGQVLLGHYSEGILSFLLNAASLSTGAFMIWKGYYFTGYILGFGLLQKFHSGGLTRVNLLVGEQKKLKSSEFNRKVRNLLLRTP